jgi:catechol 2,3-dioxygenase-like lactoylglutathione lyase family enzyme
MTNFRKILTPHVMHLPIILAIVSAGGSVRPLAVNPLAVNPLAVNNNPPDPGANPRLVNTCLITNNVEQLVAFYEPILGLRAKRSGKDYAEISTGGGVLAIFSRKAQENYIPGSAHAAKNKGMILEFLVVNLDQEYRRLQGYVKIWVKLPARTPWGTRSMYFRDPDGNLVDYYELPKVQN